jgi:diguanylate cyclase (GGDEF)-like protein/PAS domain S-box-containing protein
LITPLKSPAGHLTGYLVQVRDITERKKLAQALEQSEKRFRALIEHSTDAISLIDSSAHVIYESPSVEKLTGYSAEERIGKNGLDLIYPEDLAHIQGTMSRVLSQPNCIESAQFRSVRKNGTVWWTEGTAINLLNEPSVQAVVINYRDITERKNSEKALKDANEELNSHLSEIEKLQTELREQALRDPLTGLYNRRHLADAMERELARVKRERRSMSVIVMDIDHFKKINDNFGHQIGDKFLIQISNLIASHARSSDIACRYGGEEFLLVIPGATLTTALKRAEAIRSQCADIRITVGKKHLKVTLSLGVATFPKHGKGAEEIVIKADHAMYKAKRAGRNCVAAWE